MNFKRGIIDRFEGDYAVIETNYKQMVNIEISKLPADIKEGDVIVYNGENFVLDKEETKKLKEEIEKLCDDLWE
ncbi:hypothetical protein CLOACE_01250 [Clostridium acetireducens DSM 10703]|jgi:hypothetical protein|uniref:Uncharacterized protein n=1 Tax=Clostridium acetireducens DSM 10703 TaxID=1121290 RepID=A0A1E8F2A5_9CLOT|nr:DUF3006 domain-containing protein [Clostridium acetireducens]OFI07777.1 hypothetical protein CLOACE_01250 [Clostridium acetireducens DSM 10703]